jgi:hypothetical protein
MSASLRGLSPGDRSAAKGYVSLEPLHGEVSWDHSVVPPRPRLMPPASGAVACLLAVLAIGGCASSTNHALDDPSSSSSTPSHGSLTNDQFNVAVAVARAEMAKDAATVTSATATVGQGTVTDPNAGPACTSGTLLRIKLIGTFNIATTGFGGQPTPSSEPVSAVMITADPESGKACDLSVQTGPTTPDPGATLLFTK